MTQKQTSQHNEQNASNRDKLDFLIRRIKELVSEVMDDKQPAS